MITSDTNAPAFPSSTRFQMSPWTPKMFKFPSSITVTKASFRRCLPQTEGILFLPIRPLLPFCLGLVFVHLYLKKSLSSLGRFLFPIFTILPSFPSCPHLFIPFSLFALLHRLPKWFLWSQMLFVLLNSNWSSEV